MKAHLIGLIVCLGLSAKVVSGHGSVHEIITGLNESIAAAPSDSKLYLDRANMHLQHDAFDEALADIAVVDAQSPERIERHFLRAKVYLAQGKDLKATQSLDTFIIARPKDSEPYRLRSFAHRNLGHVESALSDIISAIDVHRSAPLEYYLFAVELLVEKRDLLAVQQMFQRAEESFGALPTFLLSKADALSELGAVGQATEAYARVRLLYPMLSFKCWRKEAALWQEHDLEKALSALLAAKSAWRELPQRQRSALQDAYTDVLNREQTLQSIVN